MWIKLSSSNPNRHHRRRFYHIASFNGEPKAVVLSFVQRAVACGLPLNDKISQTDEFRLGWGHRATCDLALNKPMTYFQNATVPTALAM